MYLTIYVISVILYVWDVGMMYNTGYVVQFLMTKDDPLVINRGAPTRGCHPGCSRSTFFKTSVATMFALKSF